MAKKNERFKAFVCTSAAGLDHYVTVYEDGGRYFGRLFQVSDDKIVLEWNFDDYVCLDDYFLYLTGGSWFCFIPETTEAVCLGRRLAQTFYVRENDDGTAHYAYFNLDDDYCLLEGNALKIERGSCFLTGELFVLAFKRKDFCKIFYLASWDVWIDPADEIHTIEGHGGYLSLDAGEEDVRYALFRDKESKGYHLLHKGKNLSRFHNAFVEKEGDKFVLYIYDGKELVVAEEGDKLVQNAQGLSLDDKFWAAKENDLLDPEIREIPKDSATSPEDDEANETGEAPAKNVVSVQEHQIPDKQGLFSRILRWMGLKK